MIGNNNPDITVIEPDGNSIKIEQIRIMNSKILEKPISSNKKVYIINNSEKMTVDAQNCLLKTLEEPPEYATIILVCNNETQMLTTIKSRCTKIAFKELSKEEISVYFEKELKEKVSSNILKLSEGSIAKAIQIKDKEELYNSIEAIIQNIEKTPKSKLFGEAEIIYKSTDDISEILDYMNILFFEKAKENISYINCIQIVEQAKKRLKSNSNYNMTIDNLIMQIWEEINEKHSRG